MGHMSSDLLGLEGRVVMVTGAGKGYGRQIALAYAENGATLVTVDPNVEKAAQIASEAEALGVTAIPIRGDFRVALDVVSTFDKVEELLGMLYGIVHVTSGESHTPFVEMLESEWYDLLNSNVKSSLYALRYGLRYLSGGGFFVVVLPPAGQIEPHVAAIRGALKGLVEGASIVFPDTLRVNGVIPSRESVGGDQDANLVRAVLGLGSSVSEGIHGSILSIGLPEAPRPTKFEDLLRQLP